MGISRILLSQIFSSVMLALLAGFFPAPALAGQAQHDGHAAMMAQMDPDCPMHQTLDQAAPAEAHQRQNSKLDSSHVRHIPTSTKMGNRLLASMNICPHRQMGMDKNLCRDCCCSLRDGAIPDLVSGSGVDFFISAGQDQTPALASLDVVLSASRPFQGPAFSPEPPPPNTRQ